MIVGQDRREKTRKAVGRFKDFTKGKARSMLLAPVPSCSKYYRIEDFTSNSVDTNGRFSMVLGRKETETIRKPSLPDVTAEDLNALEKQAMKKLQMTSRLDWQSTAVVRVISGMVNRYPSWEMKLLQKSTTIPR